LEYESAKDYEQAITLFSGIKDYKDAATHLADCQAMVDSIAAFETAKEAVTKKNDEFKKLIDESSKMLNSEDIPLDDKLISKLENAVSDAKTEIADVPEMPESAEDINKAAEELNKVDYKDAISSLNDVKGKYETSVKKYNLVNQPSEKYVIKCLKRVKNVIGIGAVTEDNDPNGKLNKAGGYTATVYFASKYLNPKKIDGKTVVDKGTDCGGAIEVYTCSEDAVKRDEYLAGFDGTILCSGSHTVIGTVVVRTSDELPASKQKKLEKMIIKELTRIKD
ncbi:MAG: hypothetical protein II699_06405, partial [Lachnospiraceae bacterium]|nr:hypothetical protein [Lachnospiraceae bacterium]